jgi:tRNA A37 threonylcarbamoyladenosine modification protein TsaB
VAAVIDARRGQVFGGLYESALLEFAGREETVLKMISGDVVASPDEFLSMVARQMKGAIPLFASPTPEVIELALASSALGAAPVEKVSGVLAPVIGRLGHGMALRGEVVDALDLGANYVRRTDAEVNWKGV